jgi:hypothetical protein
MPGFRFATVGVIYAFLVAFAVIVVGEKFSAAQDAVVQETHGGLGRSSRPFNRDIEADR